MYRWGSYIQLQNWCISHVVIFPLVSVHDEVFSWAVICYVWLFCHLVQLFLSVSWSIARLSPHIHFDVPFIGCWVVFQFLHCRIYYRIPVKFRVRYHIFLVGVFVPFGCASCWRFECSFTAQSAVFRHRSHWADHFWRELKLQLMGSFYLSPFITL